MSQFNDILRRIEQQMKSYGSLTGPNRKAESILDDLTGRVTNQNLDVTSGLYGEEVKLKRGIGTSIAAGSGGVGGSRNYLPLFNISSDFAGQRMNARTAAEQARIMQLLQISQGYGGIQGNNINIERLKLERERMEREDDINLAQLIPQIGLNFMNPFGS
jgi:hypothetical protein